MLNSILENFSFIPHNSLTNFPLDWDEPCEAPEESRSGGLGCPESDEE